MAKVYIITHRKDGHILGVCRNERAAQRRIAYLLDVCAIFTADDACIDAYEVCE